MILSLIRDTHLGEVKTMTHLKPRKGEVESYFRVDEKDLILYRSGLSLENTPIRGTASPEERDKINARLNPLKFLVGEAEGIYSEIGLCPTNFTPTRVDGKNRLWARQHVEQLDQEPEFYTI